MSDEPTATPKRKPGRPRTQLTAIVTVTMIPCPPENVAAYWAALRWIYRDRSKDQPAA